VLPVSANGAAKMGLLLGREIVAFYFLVATSRISFRTHASKRLNKYGLVVTVSEKPARDRANSLPLALGVAPGNVQHLYINSVATPG
jgi:hypothetical protein